MKIILSCNFRVLFIFVLYWFLINECNICLGKKILPEQSNNLNNCRRCKILTDSFNNWLQKTARGKYEGGDSAWEETNLKSYARSEVRLVEIQEKLCSEVKNHQDHCYTLSEEAEQLLEKWWFQENPNTSDLYSWICIENLQYCCPVGHFGDSCDTCPRDKNNKICGGNGKCDGEGTRRGNGTCICKKEFVGELCDECNKNYYRLGTECKPCHEACNGCRDKGSGACDTCKSGWQLQSAVCVDINECLNSSVCEPNEYCVNSVGAYSCVTCDRSCKSCIGSGHTNCTSCGPGNILWSGNCIDDDMRATLLTNAIRKIALYLGLILITLFVIHNSMSVSSIIILTITMFIYFSEKSSEINSLAVINNYLHYVLNRS